MLYIDDGPVITAAGTAAGIDACLHLVRKDHGSAVAAQVARRMVVAAHREGGQAQFAEHPVVAQAPADDPIGSAMSHALDNLHRPLAVGELAGVAHLSVRQFERRFIDTTGLPPGRWLTQQRIRAGTVLLASADQPVDVVAGRVGLTVAGFRHHFRRTMGVSPSAYRRQFRQAPERTASGRSVTTEA